MVFPQINVSSQEEFLDVEILGETLDGTGPWQRHPALVLHAPPRRCRAWLLLIVLDQKGSRMTRSWRHAVLASRPRAPGSTLKDLNHFHHAGTALLGKAMG